MKSKTRRAYRDAKKRVYIDLTVAHLSLQYTDPDWQKEVDIEKMLNQGYDWITGTEAGSGAGAARALLEKYCKRYGYQLSIDNRFGTWVAVSDRIIGGSKWFKKGVVPVLPASTAYTPRPKNSWGEKGITFARFNLGTWRTSDNKKHKFGKCAVGASHMLSRGSAGDALKDSSDMKYAKAIRKKFRDRWVKEDHIVFHGMDANRDDKEQDVYLGVRGLRTCWDEIQKWPNTGHGTIDVISRMTGSGRIELRGAAVSHLKLYTDHKAIVATYRIYAL